MGVTTVTGRARPRLLVIGLVVMLAGAWLAHAIQTAGGVRVMDVRFVGTGGKAMSGLLHVPPNATRETPAPAVLAIHGYFNSRETQGDFAIEFARRGYVVLALDQVGHGHSEPPAFRDGFGGPDGLRFLRSLDIVDKENIGLEGHSMGGWAAVNAAAAVPDGYRAVVLEGSGPGAPFAPEATPTFPRNLAVVFARFDEFATTMWGVGSAAEVTHSGKLRKAFGTEAPVEAGKLYGSIDDGTGRMLYRPGGTHPWNHISKTAIGNATDWFARTLQGGRPRPASDQIWQWKELGTVVALGGFVVLLLGLFEVFLRLPPFAGLQSPAVPPAGERSGRWWATLVLGAALPAATLLPFMQIGSALAPASWLLPQAFSNEIVVWALLNAALIALLGLLPGTPRFARCGLPARAALVGMLTIGVAYVAVVFVNAVFLVDLRYWFIALKPLDASQIRTFAVYSLPFIAFFLVALRALHANLALARHGVAAQYAFNVLALAGGFVVFLVVQYGLLFSGQGLATFFMNDPLRIVVSINFVPLMCIVALVSTFTFRRTGSHIPGALICGLLVAWYVVVGQATQAAA